MSDQTTTDTVDTDEAEVAAAQRGAYVEALKVERDGYKTRGLTDRVKEVEAEIKRAETGAPKGRSAPARETT